MIQRPGPRISEKRGMASIWEESFVHSFRLGRALLARLPQGIEERLLWARPGSGGDGGPLWPPEVGVRGRTLPKSGKQSWGTLPTALQREGRAGTVSRGSIHLTSIY